jgi:hypothetical protein
MAIAGRRWITNVARRVVSPHRRAVVFGVRYELTAASRAPISFPEAAGHPGLQGIGSGITI